MSAHQFEFRTITGAALPLSDYADNVLLIVNTASQCGFTPQYRELEGLWSRYQGRGLTVIGVPCNDFGGQEPGNEREIASFCEVNYSITFPLTAKESVIGADAHPFYNWVREQAGEDALPKWNFHKYLIAPDGSLAQSYPSKVSPLSETLVKEIEALLK
ncbi:glutathione peroxidase [Tepidicaulis marinus]|jgi:glutathione peroxidase|uniref:Glutathione peroxidase n=1 Tax=Tepidicaulis marinus TaxID=1333998 RepID=A0A081BA83_9HYPH|nr:glutathione peroxidase [Tepidicaulis marinus]GAK44951.1 glutathione peroxidase [Tepidicaulis marinus]